MAKIGERYQPLAVWCDYTDEVSGGPIEARHYPAEEVPDVVA